MQIFKQWHFQVIVRLRRECDEGSSENFTTLHKALQELPEQKRDVIEVGAWLPSFL